MTVLDKAWGKVIAKLNESYEELDQAFLANVRVAVEASYADLLNEKAMPKGKAKSPRGVTAFNLYVREFNAKTKDQAVPKNAEGKDISLFKRASDSWKLMSEAEKAPYVQQSKADNTAAGIVPAAERPKKPVSGYNLYIREYKAKNATLDGGTSLFKEAATAWGKLSEKQRAAFVTKATTQNAATAKANEATATAVVAPVTEAPAEVAEAAVATEAPVANEKAPAKTRAPRKPKAAPVS